MFDMGGLFASGFVLICGLWWWCNIDVGQYLLALISGAIFGRFTIFSGRIVRFGAMVGQYLLAWFSSAILPELLGFGQCLV